MEEPLALIVKSLGKAQCFPLFFEGIEWIGRDQAITEPLFCAPGGYDGASA